MSEKSVNLDLVLYFICTESSIS